MPMSLRGTLCCLFFVLLVLVAQTHAQDLLWNFRAGSGYVDCSPAVGDLDGDGVSDIVVVATSGSAVALDASGRVMWEQTVRGPITIPPTLTVRSDVPEAMVICMNNFGQVFAFEGATGRPLWHSDLPGSVEWGQTALAAADMDGDGTQEIIAGDRDGHVVCIGAAGDIRWSYQGDHGWTLCPAVADLDGDGTPEILVAGTEVPLVCLSNQGAERWRLAERTNGASPVVADLNGDGIPEIACGIDSALALVDSTGNVVWRLPMTRPIDSAITVVDANRDGIFEVYAVDLAGILICADANGKELWRADVEERARRSPSVGDVDGDGEVELLVAGYSGQIHVFNPSGALKTRVPLESASNATATLFTTVDGKIAVAVPTVAGTMKVFQWPGAKVDATVLWPEYRVNARRTASLVTEQIATMVADAAVDFGRFYVGRNTLGVQVDNPSGLPLNVHLEAVEDSAKPSVANLASSDAAIRLNLPYVIPSDRAISMVLRCTVTHEGRVLVDREQRAYVTPFQKELSDIRTVLAGLEASLPALLDVQGVDARYAFLVGKRDDFETQVLASGTATDLERRALRDGLHSYLDEIRALDALTTAAAATGHEDGIPIRVCAANPWAPFGGMDEIVEGRMGDRTLQVTAFAGEVESTALNIFNFTSDTKTFRVLANQPTLDGVETPAATSDVIELREVVDVPTDLLDLSADALPRLNEASIIQVPAWGSRQLWVTVNTRTLQPGTWHGQIVLKSLDVTPIEIVTALDVDVWPTALPEKQALRLCHWGYVHSSVLKDQPEAALTDQVSHGTDVFVGLFYPQAKFDEQGNLVGDIDYSAHDAYVREYAPHGVILFCGYQGALQGPGGIDSDAYAKASVQWLRQWVAHLRDMGVGYDGFALYPVDEPGLSDGLVDTYLRLAKLAREADPKIQMYTDPVGRISMDELKTMAPYVDIWCPNRGGFLLNSGNDMLDFIKSTGKQVWTYECLGNAKHQSPLGYYRSLAWLVWRRGLTGFGFWSYCTSQYDPWYRPGPGFDYLLIYQGNGVVASKRWEAIRRVT